MTIPNGNDQAARYAQRLLELRQDYEAGQNQLRALEQRTNELQRTMLRIAGAIEVMEQLVAEAQAGGG